MIFVLGSASPVQTTTVTTQPQPQAKPQPKKQQKKEKASKKPRNQTGAQVWVEGQTDDGHTYYYNTITGGGDNLETQLLFDVTNWPFGSD